MEIIFVMTENMWVGGRGGEGGRYSGPTQLPTTQNIFFEIFLRKNPKVCQKGGLLSHWGQF